MPAKDDGYRSHIEAYHGADDFHLHCDDDDELLGHSLRWWQSLKTLVLTVIPLVLLLGGLGETLGMIETPVGAGDTWELGENGNTVINHVSEGGSMDSATVAYIALGVAIVEGLLWALKRYIAIKADGKITLGEIVDAIEDGAEVASGIEEAVDAAVEAGESA